MSEQQPKAAKHTLQQAYSNDPKQLGELVETLALHNIGQIAIVKEGKTWLVNYTTGPIQEA